MTGLIAHEWVSTRGGSENVVEQFLEAFPGSDLQVLWNDDPTRFEAITYETWLARTPLRRSKALSLPVLPITWRTLRSHRPYEWILASSHLFAHHVRLRGANRHIPKYSYVHTPARYIWDPDVDGRGNNPMIRAAAQAFKPVDRRRATESAKIAANSEYTRLRIQRAWDLDADVIYPPVDTEAIIAGGDWRDHLGLREVDDLERLPSDFLLGASRFVSYKRLEQVIDAGEATGTPVVLAGSGPEYDSLRARAAGSTIPVTFVLSPSDAMLFALYQRARAYVFPAVEDFGIMPVEAMASGTPVIVSAQGGAVESAMMVRGGAVLREPTAAAWRGALETTDLVDRTELPERTARFSTSRFRRQIRTWIAAV